MIVIYVGMYAYVRARWLNLVGLKKIYIRN